MRIALTKSGGFKAAAIISYILTLSGVGYMMLCLEGKDVLAQTFLFGLIGTMLSGSFAIEAWPKTASFIGACAFIGGLVIFILGIILMLLGTMVAAITSGFMGVFYTGLICMFGGLFSLLLGIGISQALDGKDI